MQLLYLLVITNIWSSATFAQQASGLVGTNSFQKVDRKSYPFRCGSPVVISNMPRYRSVGAWGICGAESSRICAQWYICKQRKISDCSNLKPEEEVSTLSMQAWTWVSYNAPALYGDPSLHRNLNLLSYDADKNPIMTGAYGTLALSNSKKAFSFFSEACYPFDQLANTTKFSSESAVIQTLVKAEKFYDENKNKTEGFCEDCFSREFGNSLGILFDKARLTNALTSNTFKQFLFELIFAGCRKKITAPPPKFDAFPPIPDSDDPKSEKVTATKQQIGVKINEILSTYKAPINLDGVCFFRDKSKGNRCVFHDIAITGNDKVCKNSDCTECRERIKVHNSWGEDWQKEYTEDGFIDKQSILDNLRDPLNPGTLSWIY